ncbi:hypothetical protein AKJ09_03864 [Labilithrix luteola]|uniref:Uncharacterized protein n=1 Tax=Labilithrix luteola TaxID=1391654 RepID=A0A0K1PUI9_9BACT|nr:hypothetical protein AKJ09_03864 [Labilithrix luteola]
MAPPEREAPRGSSTFRSNSGPQTPRFANRDQEIKQEGTKVGSECRSQGIKREGKRRQEKKSPKGPSNRTSPKGTKRAKRAKLERQARQPVREMATDSCSSRRRPEVDRRENGEPRSAVHSLHSEAARRTKRSNRLPGCLDDDVRHSPHLTPSCQSPAAG